MTEALYQGLKTYKVRGVGVAAVALVGLAVVAYLADVFLLWGITVAAGQADRSDGAIDTAVTLEDLLPFAGVVTGVAQLAAVVLTMIWLWRARKNLDAFPGAQPILSAGWAIGGWFLPIANLVVPGRLMANIARQSSRARAVTGVAILWWVALVANMFIDRFANVLAENRDPAPTFEALGDHYREWAVGETLAATAGIIALAAFAVTVARVSTAQEERIHRGWYEEQNRVMGITPPPDAPPAAGSATIGA